MSKIKLETLQDAFNCYGQENLIPIDLLKQIILYTSKGVQPVFTCESEKEERKGNRIKHKCSTRIKKRFGILSNNFS